MADVWYVNLGSRFEYMKENIMSGIMEAMNQSKWIIVSASGRKESLGEYIKCKQCN